MRKFVIACIAASTLALSGCGQAPWEQSLLDLEGVQVSDPDSITLYNNVDQHPNLAVICIDGMTFVTTTRIDMGSWAYIPNGACSM